METLLEFGEGRERDERDVRGCAVSGYERVKSSVEPCGCDFDRFGVDKVGLRHSWSLSRWFQGGGLLEEFLQDFLFVGELGVEFCHGVVVGAVVVEEADEGELGVAHG